MITLVEAAVVRHENIEEHTLDGGIVLSLYPSHPLHNGPVVQGGKVGSRLSLYFSHVFSLRESQQKASSKPLCGQDHHGFLPHVLELMGMLSICTGCLFP